jgi:hypothetical protein
MGVVWNIYKGLRAWFRGGNYIFSSKSRYPWLKASVRRTIFFEPNLEIP